MIASSSRSSCPLPVARFVAGCPLPVARHSSRKGTGNWPRATDNACHLSFSVASDTIAKMMAMIQKRTTTFVSFHPESSKW